jgi:hypothetical protein
MEVAPEGAEEVVVLIGLEVLTLIRVVVVEVVVGELPEPQLDPGRHWLDGSGQGSGEWERNEWMNL